LHGRNVHFIICFGSARERTRCLRPSFHELKQAGVPVTPREYLTLIEAIEKDLAGWRIEEFYFRSALVKDVRHDPSVFMTQRDRQVQPSHRRSGAASRAVSMKQNVKGHDLAVRYGGE
jgi:hypothetical protein